MDNVEGLRKITYNYDYMIVSHLGMRAVKYATKVGPRNGYLSYENYLNDLMYCMHKITHQRH